MSETLTAGSVAAAHAEYMIGTGDALVGMMADDFYDHVSGRTGREIWAVVRRWLDESFSHRTCEVLAALADGDRIVIWFVAGGVHIGSGFPWLRGRPPSGRKVTWAQVHMFRVADGQLREHWAVRDDLRALEAIDAEGPCPPVRPILRVENPKVVVRSAVFSAAVPNGFV